MSAMAQIQGGGRMLSGEMLLLLLRNRRRRRRMFGPDVTVKINDQGMRNHFVHCVERFLS